MAMFMIAGSDSSAVTLTLTYLLLLNNPKGLEKLIKKIEIAFPSKFDSITFANTQDFPYLNACIKESMKLHPILATGLPRLTKEATVINHDEIFPDVIVSTVISELTKDPRI